MRARCICCKLDSDPSNNIRRSIFCARDTCDDDDTSDNRRRRSESVQPCWLVWCLCASTSTETHNALLSVTRNSRTAHYYPHPIRPQRHKENQAASFPDPRIVAGQLARRQRKESLRHLRFIADCGEKRRGCCAVRACIHRVSFGVFCMLRRRR